MEIVRAELVDYPDKLKFKKLRAEKLEKTAGEVTKKVRGFLVNKKQISSLEIRKKIDAALKKKNRELAFFYEHHLPNLKQL